MELQRPKPKPKKTKSKRIISELELQVQDMAFVDNVEDIGNWEDLHVEPQQFENLYPSAPAAPISIIDDDVIYPSQPLMIMDQLPEQYIDLVKNRIQYPSAPVFEEVLNTEPSFECIGNEVEEDREIVVTNLFKNETEIEFDNDYKEFRNNQSIPDEDDPFYRRVLVFEQNLKELQSERIRLSELTIRIEKFKARFWKLSKYPLKLTEKCPDGNLLTHVYSNEQASFLDQDRDNMENLLQAKRGIFYVDIPKSMFLAQSSKVWIKHHLNKVFDQKLGKELSKIQAKTNHIINLCDFESEMEQLSQILNTLFYFETNSRRPQNMQ